MLATTTKTTPLDRYLRTAQAAGCPADQLRNFRAVGYVALPKQLQFHAAARACDHVDGPVDVGYGGARGPGKSHAVLAQIGADDCQRFPGCKWLQLRKVGRAAKEGVEDLLLRAFPGWLPYFKSSSSTLAFPNGSRIILGHFQHENDVDKYLGLEYDGIAVEEATTLTRRKLETIGTCLRTSKEGWRPRMYYTFNPGGVGHAYIKQLLVQPFRAGRELLTRFIPATVDDNPHVNPEYRRTLDNLTGWLKQAWRYGDMDIAAGAYFTTWRHDIHVMAPFTIPAHWRVWMSMDYGFTHNQAVHLFAQSDEGTVYVVGEHVARQWPARRHAEAMNDLLARSGIRKDRLRGVFAGGDVFATKDGVIVADKYRDLPEHLRYDLTGADMRRAAGAMELLSALGDVEHGIRPWLYIFNTCPRLIETIPMMQHDPHNPEDVLKVDSDEDGVGGDDPYDSGRYGLMAAPSKHAWSAAALGALSSGRRV